LNESTPFKECQ